MMVLFVLMLAVAPAPEGTTLPKQERFKFNARLMRMRFANYNRMLNKFGDTNVITPPSMSSYQWKRFGAWMGGNSIKAEVYTKLRKNKDKVFWARVRRNIEWRFGSWEKIKAYFFLSKNAWYRQAIILITILTILWVLDVPALMIGVLGTVYYVDYSNGNDGYLGTLAEPAGGNGPWQTVAKVNALAPSPGDSILFKRGETWTQSGVNYLNINGRNGTNGNEITYGNYGSGDLPIIDANNLLTQGMRVNGSSYIIVDGLHVTNNGSGALVYIFNVSSHILIENCEIDYPNGTAILVRDTAYCDVEYCTASGGNSGIGFEGTSSANRVNNCTALGNTVNEPDANDCITVHGGDGGLSQPPGANFELSYNICNNGPENNLDIQGGSNITAHHNLLYDSWIPIIDTGPTSLSNGVTGLVIYSNFIHKRITDTGPAIGTRSEGSHIYNNIIVIEPACGRGITIFDEELNTNIGNIIVESNTVYLKTSSNYFALRVQNYEGRLQDTLTIKNNIFVHHQSTVASFMDEWPNSTIDGNCYYSTHGTTTINYNSSDYTSIASFNTATGHEANGVFGDPLFEDITGATNGYPEDLILQAGSPAMNTGIATTITLDYAGGSRNLATPTMGAYEGTEPAPTYSISGTILVSATPLSGVLVTDGYHSDYTDASGEFTLTTVGVGSWPVTASLVGYSFSPSVQNVLVSDDDVEDIDFTGTIREVRTIYDGEVSSIYDNETIDINLIDVLDGGNIRTVADTPVGVHITGDIYVHDTGVAGHEGGVSGGITVDGDRLGFSGGTFIGEFTRDADSYYIVEVGNLSEIGIAASSGGSPIYELELIPGDTLVFDANSPEGTIIIDEDTVPIGIDASVANDVTLEGDGVHFLILGVSSNLTGLAGMTNVRIRTEPLGGV
jgi:hypothetical protein